MLNLRKVAVTGPISSGKSLVCEMFAQLGAYITFSDEIVHRLLTTDKTLQNQVNHLLNIQINFSSSAYRQQIADLVFEDKNLLNKLEKLLHPRVFAEMAKVFEEKQKEDKYPLWVCEVPLLFETHMESFFDTILYVYAEPSICKKRYTQSSKHPESDWERRMKRFNPSEENMKKASVVLFNDKSPEHLKLSVKNLYSSLIQT